MSHGLWRYTRHPNYFGDFLVWWGFFLISLAATGKWWTILSPLLMSWLLMRVSGVALLEKTITQRRPEYDDYIRRTSAFFPWPPRNG
jgi:steroid 5-alpha reductase family enzyme